MKTTTSNILQVQVLRKIMIRFILLVVFLSNSNTIKAQTVTIPDANFAAWLTTKYPSCMSGGNQMDTTCADIINEEYVYIGNQNISDLTGIQYFDNLDELACSDNTLTNLPTLPAALRYLYCDYNLLASLPTLPAKLRELDCYNNNLTNLPALPDSLYYIACEFNQLTSLPALPDSLVQFYCGSNLLASLPALPVALRELDCGNNLLTSLPTFPDSLNYIYCSINQLTSLPALPVALRVLYCQTNQLTSLPALPVALRELYCTNNQLTSLPALPDSLRILECEENQIFCLPFLPGSLVYFGFDDEDYIITCVPNKPFGLISQLTGYPICNSISNSNGCETYATITGTSFYDANNNCVQDGNEKGLANRIIKINNDYSYAITDSNGFYFAGVANLGSYTIDQTIYNPAFWSIDCPNIPYNVNITSNTDSIGGNDFPNKALVTCPWLSVDIATSRQRMCFNNSYVVNYCNVGTDVANNVSIEVTFPPEIIPTSSTLPWSNVNGQTYTFNVGDLDIEQSGSFIITDSVTCDALLGQTACVTAAIFPKNTCYPTSTSWDNSNLSAEGICNGTTIDFTITNIGIGNMGGTSNYRIYQDDILLVTNQSFQLNSGAILNVPSVTANGKTYRIDVDQRPNNPIKSRSRSVIEVCGDPTFSLGFVNSISQDDVEDDVETDCHVLTNSYDPNEKIVMPTGKSLSHYITNNDELEYIINFQNTGNDTAYKVVVMDSLDVAHLDPTSLRAGASSHPYKLDVSGNCVLRFIFNNINLLDSTNHEPQSHGFVKYKIKQRANNPVGDVITNKAYIFFDFNNPIITNETFNTIEAAEITAIASVYKDQVTVATFPNPFNETVKFDIKGIDKTEITLEVYDALGQMVSSKEYTNAKSIVYNRNGLTEGMYFYKLLSNKQLIATGKLMVK